MPVWLASHLALSFREEWEGRERGHISPPPGVAAPCLLCKAPRGSVPTHEQPQNQETEAGMSPVQGETAPPPTTAPPTLCSRFLSLPPPLHVGARRDSALTWAAPSLPPSAAASRVQPTCRLSTHEQGPRPRGCAHRPLLRGADHACTVHPTQPPCARVGSREGGGSGARRKGRRGGTWRAAPRGHKLRASVTTDPCKERGSADCPARGEPELIPQGDLSVAVTFTVPSEVCPGLSPPAPHWCRHGLREGQRLATPTHGPKSLSILVDPPSPLNPSPTSLRS